MGTPREPPPVKLIAGLLAASPELLEAARAALQDAFGLIDAASSPHPWTVSTYYASEMGDEIWRQFVAFADPLQPGELAGIKERTNALERRWIAETGRRVNIDPGYLDLTKLVLASTKDAAHRIYLGRGIYAEATLYFARGSFAPYGYTYPDYAAPPAIAFFNQVREAWKAKR